MHITVRIRLTSYLLGDDPQRASVPGQPPVYRFRRPQRHRNEGWAIDAEWWGWLMRDSVEGCQLPIMADCIMPPVTIKLPTLHLLCTRHQQIPGRKDSYEAMRTGTILTTSFALLSAPPGGVAPGKRVPTLEDLRALFAYVGKYVGISPARSAHGYGRFELLSLEESAPA